MPELEHVSKNGERFLYIHGPKPEYEADDDRDDRRYIPSRVIPLIRPGKDIIVLPDDDTVRQFADFCADILGLDPWQTIFVPGNEYLMEDRSLRILGMLREFVSQGAWLGMPYSVTGQLLRVVETLGGNIRLFGDERSWIERFGGKDILHPNAFPDRRRGGLPLIRGVRVAAGYVAGSQDELVRAYDLLRERNIRRMILKPTTSATGEGITKDVTRGSLSSYRFPLGPVVLEECLEIDRDEKGREITPSIQFCGCRIGEPTDQLLNGYAYAGNRGPCSASREFQEGFRSMTEQVLTWMRPQGPGGLDVLSVQGKPVLVDVNVGRWTGAHPIKFFRSLYARGAAFSCRKVVPRYRIKEFWGELERLGIAFLPGESSSGIFPLCYLTGMWGMLAAFAPTVAEADELLQRAIALA
jgi:hypothetical protein